MLYPFPTEDLFTSEMPEGWQLNIVPNESLGFHYWMMQKEMHLNVNRLFRLSLLIAPRVIEWLLEFMDRKPSYRKIMFLTRH